MQTGSTYKTNTMAVVSLISGILSWFMLPLIGAIVAIITGHMARTQIRESFGTETGDILAIIGLILGYLHLALSCLLVLFFVLIFGGMIGLGGCAIMTDSASYFSTEMALPLFPAG